MLQIFSAGVFLIAFNLLAANIPGIMPQLSRFSGLLILFALFGLYLPIKIDKSHLKIAIPAIFAMLVSSALLLREFANFLGIAIFISSLDVLLKVTNSQKNDSLPIFLLATVFYTALPLKTGWIHCLEKRPHQITKHIGDDHETAIWVGASLRIFPPAQPVIIGKRGWADTGNHRNTKRAYLGDYKRGPDEQLGDIVLVAESYYGKGKVLVFGDTSTLQNGVLMSSYPFLNRIFDWLSRSGCTQHPVRNLLLALFLLIPAGYLLSKTRLSIVLVLMCFLVANIALLITSYAGATHAETRSQIHKVPDSTPYHPAYIDVSHLERFGISASTGNSVWGISINLMRNGYIPLFMKHFSEQVLFNSRLFVVIAPTVKFGRHEIDVLKRFMQNGGIIIWTVGWEELEASKRFIEEFNFSIDSVPLGPAEVDIEKEKVKFFEAWPVVGGSDSKQIIAQKWNYPILVYQPVGKGGLLLAGDSGFLLSKNLESYKGHNVKNIRFLKYLFERLKTGIKK